MVGAWSQAAWCRVSLSYDSCHAGGMGVVAVCILLARKSSSPCPDFTHQAQRAHAGLRSVNASAPASQRRTPLARRLSSFVTQWVRGPAQLQQCSELSYALSPNCPATTLATLCWTSTKSIALRGQPGPCGRSQQPDRCCLSRCAPRAACGRGLARAGGAVWAYGRGGAGPAGYDSIVSRDGWVAEWFKAAVLKTAVRVSAPWVRIPPHPPNDYTQAL